MSAYQQWKKLGKPTDHLMECWLLSQSNIPTTADDHVWAEWELSDLASDDPEKAWECILYAVPDTRFSDHLGLLAAGVLKNLLSYHGPDFIDRVEHQAKVDPKFAWTLGGVWRFQMSDEIWHRVQAVWGRSGWDGIPAKA
ncbi:hypothetical protein GCM10027285_18490 [Oleiagrimonas citrea]|uniref:DUF6869 domain-containing protein n=1 Tax=Oleiagrimonas citrea TaxID=1665687 RepID=A0A846ZJS5_9GAMM|nr:hypothetical protein [Oleiagrimonas citrea]NKZ37833.1 hypothetical protein [Oleiagrimonas citrea]